MSTQGAVAGPTSAFQSLRAVEYTPRHPDSGMNAKSLLVMLQHPSIESLDIALNLSGALPPNYGIIRTSSVTKLHLWNYGIAAGELATSLNIPRQLTHFSCNSTYDMPFGPAMSSVQASLQHLTLMPRGHDGELCETGSLRAWPELRSLRCRLEHVLGDQLAPYPPTWSTCFRQASTCWISCCIIVAWSDCRWSSVRLSRCSRGRRSWFRG